VRNAESGATLEWGTKMASTVRGKRERKRFRLHLRLQKGRKLCRPHSGRSAKSIPTLVTCRAVRSNLKVPLSQGDQGFGFACHSLRDITYRPYVFSHCSERAKLATPSLSSPSAIRLLVGPRPPTVIRSFE
jgi:hypothetical protein